MAISYVASGTFTAANSTSSGSVGLPAGLASGDVMILAVMSRATSTSITTPAGWTLIKSRATTTTHRLSVYYRVAGSSESAPTVTQSVSQLIACRISAFRGCDQTTPLDVESKGKTGGSSTTFSASSITPASGGSMIVWVASTDDDNTVTAGTGTQAYSSDTTTGSDGSLNLYYLLQSVAASSGSNLFTQGANGPDTWNSVTIALRSAAVAASDPSTALADSVSFAVEVAFTDTPFAPSPTWTDVSAYVRALDVVIDRGRNSEFSDVQPGTATLTFNNRGRVFDPDYSSGPYYGYLLPMKRIRVRTRYSSTNYTLFDGYVQSWPQNYLPGDRESTVTITAIDMFSLLSVWPTPDTLLELVVLGDGPTSYFPMDDESSLTTGTVRDLSGNGHDATYTRFNTVDSPLTGEQGRNAKQVVGVAGVASSVTPVTFQGTTTDILRTVEAWVQFNNLTASGNSAVATNVFTFRFDFTHGYYTIHADGVGATDFGWGCGLTDAASSVSSDITAPVTDDTLYHVAATLDDTNTTLTFYVNGQSVGTRDVSALAFSGGSNTGNGRIFITGTVDATVAHYATYDTALTAAQILEHYDAGTTGGYLQTASARLTQLADYAGLVNASAYTSSGLGANTYLNLAQLGGSVLAEMQKCVTAAQGRLFVSKSGILTAQGRNADWDGTVSTNTTSQATFGDSGAELRYMDIEPVQSTVDQLRNAIAVNGGGVSISTVSADSISLYGRREESIAADLHDPSAARNLGLSRIRRYATPTNRFDSITITARKSPTTLYPIVLAAELGYRYTVSRRPLGGTVVTKTVTLEGIQHQFNHSQWLTTLYLAPAHDIYSAHPWFVLGDATYGTLGSTNLLPY